jgi:hypothetical protein
MVILPHVDPGRYALLYSTINARDDGDSKSSTAAPAIAKFSLPWEREDSSSVTFPDRLDGLHPPAAAEEHPSSLRASWTDPKN